MYALYLYVHCQGCVSLGLPTNKYDLILQQRKNSAIILDLRSVQSRLKEAQNKKTSAVGQRTLTNGRIAGSIRMGRTRDEVSQHKNKTLHIYFDI